MSKPLSITQEGENYLSKRVFGGIDFGAAVSILRTARGMTRKELSAKCGMEETRVSRIEVGGISSNPTVSTLRTLASGLDTDVRTLITIQDDIINLLNKDLV